MPFKVQDGGSVAQAKNLYVNQAGVLVPIRRGHVRVGEALVRIYAAEVVVELSSGANIDFSTLSGFGGGVWADNTRKRVVIPPGVTIGSTAVGTAALRTGTGWGGQLVVENAGSIQGAGGAANGGVGGNAFQADQPGVIFNNSGTIYAGGGGGGRGGNGGNGSYNYNHREPASGWTNTSATQWYEVRGGDNSDEYYYSYYGRWGGSIFYTASTGGTQSSPPSSYSAGGWTYLRGSAGGFPGSRSWGIARQQTRTQATTGGAGGNGGRGQGYSQARANGSAGAAGGTNAGAGGTGGGGGTWGVAGSQGNTGGNGNVSNGAVGAAGGLAGFAIVNPANVVLTNTGTILGR